MDSSSFLVYKNESPFVSLAKTQKRLDRFEYLFFCSTLSEFENFLLCERILINVTTCQNETSS
jgi:hypothetical protein